jgi:YbbR domain-containing protein
MSQGLDMLQLQLNNMISPYGIDVNVDELTVAQVAEVIGRVNDGADTKQEIEEAIELARAK